MTPTTLAETILRDVKRHSLDFCDQMEIDKDGVWMPEADILAALSRALDPAIAQQAGEVARRLDAVSLDVGYSSTTTLDSGVVRQAADLITALLAQIAVLLAERDGWKQWSENWRDSAQRCLAVAEKQEARATAAEAREERLRGALERIKADDQHQSEWRYWEKEDGYFAKIARAALTETATTEEGK